MSLILGRAKLKDVQAATTLLLSPFEHGSLHTWRIRVNRAIGPLLGADMSSFLIPSAPEKPFLSEELPPITQASYPEIKAKLDRKYRFPEREVALGVWNRHMLWRPYLKELYASEYYNDFV